MLAAVATGQRFANFSADGDEIRNVGSRLLRREPTCITRSWMSGTAFAPENPLEIALLATSADPAARASFYRVLMTEKLYVIDRRPANTASGARLLEAGTELRLDNIDIDGVPHVPMFSSVTRIQQVVSEPVTYLAADARALLSLVRGSHVMLNPGAAFGKQLVPDEIDAILDGSILSGVTSHRVETETPILIGQPAVYPTHIVGALAALFKTDCAVRAAYLAHYHNPQRDSRPHTLIAIDAEGGDLRQPLLERIHTVLEDVAGLDEIVDVVRLDEDDDLGRYFVERTQPFYARQLH